MVNVAIADLAILKTQWNGFAIRDYSFGESSNRKLLDSLVILKDLKDKGVDEFFLKKDLVKLLLKTYSWFHPYEIDVYITTMITRQPLPSKLVLKLYTRLIHENIDNVEFFSITTLLMIHCPYPLGQNVSNYKRFRKEIKKTQLKIPKYNKEIEYLCDSSNLRKTIVELATTHELDSLDRWVSQFLINIAFMNYVAMFTYIDRSPVFNLSRRRSVMKLFKDLPEGAKNESKSIWRYLGVLIERFRQGGSKRS